jgi:hypothetical protein
VVFLTPLKRLLIILILIEFLSMLALFVQIILSQRGLSQIVLSQNVLKGP